MPRKKYINKNFRGKSLQIIEYANEIIEEYQGDGLELTIRQLYYQFVARDLIPNKDSEYKKIVSIISDARLAGLIDWEAIVDRTRNVRENSHWTSPASIIASAASSYAIDKWMGQETRCEVWIEKDALIGVIEDSCRQEDVPFFSCRGYNSQSEMWVAAERMAREMRFRSGEVEKIIVFHLGDHDPSGMDMTRDIQDRLSLLSYDAEIEVRRIALNMDQVRQYNPPPNPAKITDTRARAYIERYGDESWELDALEPRVLRDLITTNIRAIRDEDLWNTQVELQEGQRIRLQVLADEWEDEDQ